MIKLSKFTENTKLDYTAVRCSRPEPQYLILNDSNDPKEAKVPVESFKNKKMHSWEEVESHDNIAMLIPDGVVVLDFDELESAAKIKSILADFELDALQVETSRGLHVYFHSDKPLKNSTKVTLLCGLVCDIKSWGSNAYVKVKSNGKIRPNAPVGDREAALKELAAYPEWLLPMRGDAPIMEQGNRNQGLFEYSYRLQHLDVSQQGVIDAITIYNKYILEEPLSDHELQTILRDESFLPDPEKGNRPWFEVKEGKRGGITVIFHHEILAEYLIKKHHLINYNGVVYRYSNSRGYYIPSDTDDALNHIMVSEYKNSRISERREVLASIRAFEYKYSMQKQDEYVLNVKNGRLDLLTGQLSPHSPDFYDFQQIPVEYCPAAQSDLLDKTLRKLFPSDELEALFEEMVGQCLIKNAKMRGAFYLCGEGSNGKSTILAMIQSLLGEGNYSAMVPEQITTTGFDTAELENKLANIGDDIGKARIKENAAFKKAVTGEAMQVQRKGKDPFNLRSYATMIFAANDMPGDSDTSYGSKSRRIIVPLVGRFSADDPDFDPDILDKLTAPRVLSALLNRALHGIARLHKNKAFTIPKEVSDANQRFNDENTYVGQWKLDCELTEEDLINKTPQEIRNEFNQWVADSGGKNIGYTNLVFGKLIAQHFPGVETFVVKQNGVCVRQYRRKIV